MWGESEGGHAGEVDGGGQEVEVGSDARLTPHTGAASAVMTAHEVGDLALDFESGPVDYYSVVVYVRPCRGSAHGSHALPGSVG